MNALDVIDRVTLLLNTDEYSVIKRRNAQAIYGYAQKLLKRFWAHAVC